MKYKAQVDCFSNGRMCKAGEVYDFGKAESKYLVAVEKAKKVVKLKRKLR